MVFDPKVIEPAIQMERTVDGLRLIEIDTQKATYQGLKWDALGDFGKRKFENLLILSRPEERLKIRYV